MQREARDRERQLRVVVSAGERAGIEERAKAASLSISAYLRTAGLGQPIRSTLDHAVLELAKVNGDQGRLGGLLKLWLVDRPGRGCLRRTPSPARSDRRAARAAGRSGRPGLIAKRIMAPKGGAGFGRSWVVG